MTQSAEAIAQEVYRLAVAGHPRVDPVYFFVEVIDEETANTVATFRHLDRVAAYAQLKGISQDQAMQEIESGATQLTDARDVAIGEWQNLLDTNDRDPIDAYSRSIEQPWLHDFAVAAMITPIEAIAWLTHAHALY